METISTSIPYVPKIPSKPHYFHHLKPPPLLHSTTVAGKPSASLSTKSTASHHKYIPQNLQPTSQPIRSPSRLQTHRTNAATGYAAALVDAALCSDVLEAVYKDVKRLLKWLNNNEMLKDLMGDVCVEESVKGRVIKEVTEKGKFQRQVAAMVKMLVAKNKSGMVVKVMEEFEGIYSCLVVPN